MILQILLLLLLLLLLLPQLVIRRMVIRTMTGGCNVYHNPKMKTRISIIKVIITHKKVKPQTPPPHSNFLENQKHSLTVSNQQATRISHWNAYITRVFVLNQQNYHKTAKMWWMRNSKWPATRLFTLEIVNVLSGSAWQEGHIYSFSCWTIP